MSVIIQNNGIFRIADITSTTDKLQKGVYLLNFDPDQGYYLSLKEDFKLPKKIYGDHSIIDRWITSFENNTEKNLGIILSGLKGTGKTITAQKFCMETDLPVIIINAAWKGPGFVDFITNPVLGKCIIFVDEFEKIYDIQKDPDCSRDLLSIMDGQYPTNLIFLLTVNNFKINEFLINRLNRVKYRKHYDNLEDDVVNEVIEDLLIDKNHKDSIFDFFDTIGMCTFDLLVNIIKEMNLFNEDAITCGKHLNLEIEPNWYRITEHFGNEDFDCASKKLTLHGDTEIEIRRFDTKHFNKKGIFLSSVFIAKLGRDGNATMEKIGRRMRKLIVKQNVSIHRPLPPDAVVSEPAPNGDIYAEFLNENSEIETFEVIEKDGERYYEDYEIKEFVFTLSPEKITASVF